MLPQVAARVNVAARQKMGKALAHYHSSWLRVGLQVVLSQPGLGATELLNIFFMVREDEGLNGKLQQVMAFPGQVAPRALLSPWPLLPETRKVTRRVTI